MSEVLPEIFAELGGETAQAFGDAGGQFADFFEDTAAREQAGLDAIAGAESKVTGAENKITDMLGDVGSGSSGAGEMAGSPGAGEVAGSPGVDATGDAAAGGGTGLTDTVGGDADAAAQSPEDQNPVNDPVDVGTGNVIVYHVDVELEAALPLVFRRSHRSSYRGGRWFGRTWASTLDQRLEVSGSGVLAADDEGAVLSYPHPGDDGEPVLPKAGRLWPLAREGEAYTVTDPQAGIVRRFEARPGFYVSAEGFGELPLVSVTDRSGQAITFNYDVNGVPESVVHDGGYVLRVQAEGGRVTALVLAGADDDGEDVRLMAYRYDEAGNLSDIVNSSGQPMRQTYDEVGRLTGWTDRNGFSYSYFYDEDGRCIRGEGPGGALSGTLAYDRDNMITTHTDAAGAVTVYELTARSAVAAVTDPLGNVTRAAYDARGQMVSRTDPLGRVIQFAYDDRGNLTVVTRPDGSQSNAVYNELNLPVAVTGPGGETWRQDYDQAGNLLRRQAPDGTVTGFSYDQRGHLASVTDPLGAVTRVVCDPAGLPVLITNPEGTFTRFERDAFGRVTAITAPDGAVIRQTWTLEGRLASRTFPDGSIEQLGYDAEGNMIRHAGRAGAVRQYEYGCFDKVTAVIDPDGTRIEFGYDSLLRRAAVTLQGASGAAGTSGPADLTWRYEHDAAGRLVAETDYNGATTRYSRDAAGQVRRLVNGAGQEVVYEYNLLGSASHRFGDASVTRYGYDPAGRLTRAESPGAVVEFERDAMGRVTAESCNGQTVRSFYDAAGRRVRRVTPSGAQTVWAYDAEGRPLTMQAGGQELRFGYDRAGREITRELPGGVRLAQDWDADGRLASQVLTAGAGAGSSGAGHSVLQRRDYRYRADGYLTGIADLLSGPRQFGLDSAGQVTSVTGPDGTESYAYDPAGNITSAAWPTPPGALPALPWTGADVQGVRQYAGTLITRCGDVRYEYDGLGRVTLRQRTRLSRKPETWRYEWDADSNLTAVTTPDGTRWRYIYDALNRRIAKQRLAPDDSVAEHTSFTWDDLVIAEQASEAAAPAGLTTAVARPARLTTWDYEPDSFTPLIQVSRDRRGPGDAWQPSQGEVAAQFYAIVTDLIGAPAELISADGTLAGYQQRTLWGLTAWHSGGATTPLRFPGQYADPETGLHYNNNRYYDPATGRYLSPDPLGLDPAPNHHTYVPNPTAFTDPLGLGIFGGGPPKCANEDDFPGWQNEPVDANAGLRGDVTGYSGHARTRMSQRGMSEDMVEDTLARGKRTRGDSPGTYKYTHKNNTVIINKKGVVVTVEKK